MTSPSPFRGRWLLATILVILATVFFLFLGTWQLQRRDERLAANARVLARLELPLIHVTGELLDPEEADLRRATVRGVFDYEQEIVLRNRSWNELPGVHVLVPLRVRGTERAILVDRGWIPYDVAAREARAIYHNSNGEVEVYGVLRKSHVRRGSMSPVDPSPAPGGRVDAWHRVDLPKIAQQVPYPLLTVYLEEDVRPGGTARIVPKPQPNIRLDEGSHLGYAIQWFAFAAVAVGGYAAYYVQRTGRNGPSRKV